MELIFDEENLKRVAEIVRHFNPHARKRDNATLVEFMKQVAHENLTEKPSYVSTGGFMLTSYYTFGQPKTVLYIKASVDTSCFHGVL